MKTAFRICFLILIAVGCSGIGAPVVNVPIVFISTPVNNARFIQGLVANFQGRAEDVEDLNVTDLQWSSDIDGSIGQGASIDITSLSLGDHAITLTATDKDGNEGTKTIGISVVLPPPDLSGDWGVTGRKRGVPSLPDGCYVLVVTKWNIGQTGFNLNGTHRGSGVPICNPTERDNSGTMRGEVTADRVSMTITDAAGTWLLEGNISDSFPTSFSISGSHTTDNTRTYSLTFTRQP